MRGLFPKKNSRVPIQGKAMTTAFALLGMLKGCIDDRPQFSGCERRAVPNAFSQWSRILSMTGCLTDNQTLFNVH